MKFSSLGLSLLFILLELPFANAQRAENSMPGLDVSAEHLQINDSEYYVGAKTFYVVGDQVEIYEQAYLAPIHLRCIQKQANDILVAIQNPLVQKLLSSPGIIYLKIILNDNNPSRSSTSDNEIPYGINVTANGVIVRAILTSKRTCVTTTSSMLTSTVTAWTNEAKHQISNQVQNTNRAIFKALFDRKQTPKKKQ